MKKILISSLVLVIVFSACSKSNNDSNSSCNLNYQPCAIVAPQVETDTILNYLNAQNITAVLHCSGMYYSVVEPGTGRTSDNCSMIAIKYKGSLTNSKVFEDRSTDALVYKLGQFIEGFQNGIPYIKEGGIIDLYIPPSLAYGNQQVGNIPPNSVLIFRVNLISIQ